MNDEERFLPDKVDIPVMPDEWSPDESVITIRKLTLVVKPKIEDIVHEFFVAHEKIVRKECPGWTWYRFCEESGYSPTTPIRWFEKYGLPITKIAGRPNNANALLRESTKERRLSVVKEAGSIVEAIKRGEVDDSTLTTVADAIADRIASGDSSAEVGTKMAGTVKHAFKPETPPPAPKPVDNFERLKKHAQALAEGLQFWVDGTMKPESEEEAIAARIVMDAGPSIVVHFSRLGLNIIRIWEMFIDPDRRRDGSREDGDMIEVLKIFEDMTVEEPKKDGAQKRSLELVERQ